MYNEGHDEWLAQQDEISTLWAIFAIIACWTAISAGFKKSRRQGIINTSIVAGVLYLYFTVPVINTVLTMGFVLIMSVFLVKAMWDNF